MFYLNQNYINFGFLKMNFLGLPMERYRSTSKKTKYVHPYILVLY